MGLQIDLQVGGTQQLTGGGETLINQGIIRGNTALQTLTVGNTSSMTLTNAAGGLIEALGYANFYLLTTVLAVPGILLFWFMMRRGMIDRALGTAGRTDREEPDA